MIAPTMSYIIILRFDTLPHPAAHVIIIIIIIIIIIFFKRIPPIHHTKLYAKMFYKGNLTYEPKS